jgi:hypothetical protein
MINMKNGVRITLCLVLLGISLFQCTTTTTNNVEASSSKKEVVSIKGKIAVKGNEPHTYVAIVTEDKREYRIVGDLETEIRRVYQQKIVIVDGIIVKESNSPLIPPELEVLKIEEAPG